VETARKADVAIVFVADRQGEGADRGTLRLPGDQDALVSAVIAANPRTIVVLNTAGAVSMPWAHKAAAILQLWYPGDAFGTAASRLLFGDASPQGRLPLTFPANETQGPATEARNYPGTVAADGSLDRAYFDEELLVGYRWYDAKKQQPLFPFGYGLSYSRFRVEGISVSRADSTLHVRSTVTNTGDREDAEVLQVYVGFAAEEHEPPQRLVAFEKLKLPPRGKRSVEISIPSKALEIWDTTERRWRQTTRPIEVLVGRSSRDVLLRTTLIP
jgi:beta-glucosidase